MNKKVASIFIILLVVTYPFLATPLAEITFGNIYRKSFQNIDSDLIINSIRTVLYIFYWVDKLPLIFIRPLIMALIVWGGARYLELNTVIELKKLFGVFFSLELILLFNDYFNIAYNYFQLYSNKNLTINLSPLNLYYYFEKNITSKSLVYIWESINIFSFLYFYKIFRYIKFNYHINALTSYIFTFNLIIVYIILAIIHPGSVLFSST